MPHAGQPPQTSPPGIAGHDAAPPAPTATSDAPLPTGLSAAEAARILQADGPNMVADTAVHPLRDMAAKFWAPVPWLLEAAIILQLVLGDDIEALIIAALLIFNAVLGYVQASRAQATLGALKARLALQAAVRRDGAWALIPAAGLVRGDIIKLSLGGIVPADATLLGGDVLLDQSMITGESVPAEAEAGAVAYAGTLIRRGEAVAEITATGGRTKFGKTAELVRDAHVQSTQQLAVLRVVRNLAIFNGTITLALLAYAAALGLPGSALIPLVLTAILASIPVALPATFTLAASIGARSLAAIGVLPTRLSAVDEAASMTILCSDKTGTLTRNELKVVATEMVDGTDVARLLGLAALASSEGGQDPVDMAIRAAAAEAPASGLPGLTSFIPFDPANKMAQAMVSGPDQSAWRVVKGAYATIGKLATDIPADLAAAEAALEAKGYRVLAVAYGPAAAPRMVGLIALSDPPRPEAAAMLQELSDLGVRTVMVTGDAPATAAIVAAAVGLVGPACPAADMPDTLRAEDFAVYAGVLPEDKFRLVKAFQKSGHVVGMCGDGANDAPALRQAQMGIAVATATDVAKSAAGIVLTTSGLAGVVAAVKEGRITFQRIQTYALNVIIKKFVMVLFLAIGLIMTGHAVLTPMLMVILMVIGDFLTMALTTDHVTPSPVPNIWRIGNLSIAGVALGIFLLAFCCAVLAFGAYQLRLDLDALRTLAFLAVAFGAQTTIYAIRERRHFWHTAPSRWLVICSLGDMAISAALAVSGTFMAPLSPVLVGATLVAAALFGLVLALVKLPLFARLHLT